MRKCKKIFENGWRLVAGAISALGVISSSHNGEVGEIRGERREVTVTVSHGEETVEMVDLAGEG